MDGVVDAGCIDGQMDEVVEAGCRANSAQASEDMIWVVKSFLMMRIIIIITTLKTVFLCFHPLQPEAYLHSCCCAICRLMETFACILQCVISYCF